MKSTRRKRLILLLALLLAARSLLQPLAAAEAFGAENTVSSDIVSGNAPALPEESGMEGAASGTASGSGEVSDTAVSEIAETQNEEQPYDEGTESVDGVPYDGVQETPEEDDLTDEALNGEDEDTGTDKISELNRLLKDRIIMAVLYLCDTYPLREDASEGAPVTAEIECGTTLYLERALYNGETLWFKVAAYTEEGEVRGYIPRERFVCVDEGFLGWEESFASPAPEEEGADTAEDAVVNEALYAAAGQSVDSFPDSYRSGLKKLQEKHPNWIFVPQKVGITLEAVVKAELSDPERNYVYYTVDDSYKAGKVDNTWYYASEEGLKHYMNPANFVGSEQNIFMFEQLTYNESYHTADGVKSVLKGSFMSGDIPSEGISYARAFQEIGEKLKVSPYHLAAKVYQEQGSKGTSPLISGTYSGYEGYYNYFNIRASGKTNAEIYKNGLSYAKEQGWDTRYKSLKGGAEFDAKNYILAGQDTAYLEKYNIIKKKYSHQYMQNASAPLTEASKVYSMYKNSGALDNPFVFKIPVFDGDPVSDPVDPEPVVKSGTMKLSAVSLKLNTALSVSQNGMRSITAIMKNGDLPVTLTGIKGTNAASRRLLDTGYLKTVLDGDTLQLGLVPENREGIKAGAYSFEVKGSATASELLSYDFKAVKLTVRVVDKAPEKLFALKAKGSVNLVDREDKYIIYTPKITDLGSTRLKDALIEGDASGLFEAALYEKGSTLPGGKEVTASQGVIMLKARSGVSMNRAKAYPVKIVSTLDNGLKIEKTVKVKPVQSPAKTTAKLSANIIPMDGKPVELTVRSAGKTENDTVIESVELVSEKHGRFFDFLPSAASDDPHVLTGELRANESILRPGKYTLKFNVTYRGHGANVKPSVITLNVRVK